MDAEISTDVVSNVQLGSVQLYFVLIMLRTERALDCIASTMYSWSTKAWRLLFQVCFPKDDARLMLTVVLAVLVDTNDVVAEAGDAMDVDVILKRSSKCASGRNRDSEFVCWYYEKRQCGKVGLGVRSREASVFESSWRSLAETRCVDMVNIDLNTLEIGAVLLPVRNYEIQVGIDSHAAATVFAYSRWFVTKSCKSCVDLSARKVKGNLRGVSLWVCESENGRDMRSLGGQCQRTTYVTMCSSLITMKVLECERTTSHGCKFRALANA